MPLLENTIKMNSRKMRGLGVMHYYLQGIGKGYIRNKWVNINEANCLMHVFQ